MWNLLVVEDEAIVRLALRTMVDWQELGIEWAGEAAGGEEALKLFEQKEIDLVLTDIRMPRMNGIDLAKRIKERKPHMPIVFLTSYDDFTYVQEALRIGAVDYLHKPTMGEEELKRALQKVLDMLKGQQGAARGPTKLLTEEERNDFLLTMLDAYIFPDHWEEGWTMFQLPTISKGYFLCSFRVVDEQHASSAQLQHTRIATAWHFMAEYVKPDYNSVFMQRGDREILWLCEAAAPGEWDRLSAYIEGLIRKVSELLHMDISCSFSRHHRELTELPEAYMESLLQAPVDERNMTAIVRMAKAIVNEQYRNEHLSLASLAEQLNYSVSHLSRLFAKEVGENFNKYLTRRRIHQAKILLRENQLKVYEIAEEVGYKNAQYFSNLFKEMTGVTPNEFRNPKGN